MSVSTEIVHSKSLDPLFGAGLRDSDNISRVDGVTLRNRQFHGVGWKMAIDDGDRFPDGFHSSTGDFNQRATVESSGEKCRS